MTTTYAVCIYSGKTEYTLKEFATLKEAQTMYDSLKTGNTVRIVVRHRDKDGRLFMSQTLPA